MRQSKINIYVCILNEGTLHCALHSKSVLTVECNILSCSWNVLELSVHKNKV